MKISKHFKLTLSLLGLMALAMSVALSSGEGSLGHSALLKTAQAEVQCDFRKNVFKQWAYIFSERTSCVYR